MMRPGSSHDTMPHGAVRHIGISVEPRFRSSGSSRASLERVVFRFHRMLPSMCGTRASWRESIHVPRGKDASRRRDCGWPQAFGPGADTEPRGELKASYRARENREFKLDKSTFCSLHALVARNEALEWGHFRGEGLETQFTPTSLWVSVGDLHHWPQNQARFVSMRCSRAEYARWGTTFQIRSSGQRHFFYSDRFNSFFFDGNKRTSRFMMNGVLMTEESTPSAFPPCVLRNSTHGWSISTLVGTPPR